MRLTYSTRSGIVAARPRAAAATRRARRSVTAPHGAPWERRLGIGRKEDIAAALAAILAGSTEVGKRHHPGIDRRAGEREAGRHRGRHLDHHRTAAQVEHHDRERSLVVRGRQLVAGQRQVRHVDHVAGPGAEVAHHRVAETGEAHRRHAPDRRLYASLVGELMAQILAHRPLSSFSGFRCAPRGAPRSSPR